MPEKNIKDFISLYQNCEIQTVGGLGINLGLYYPSAWTKQGNLEPNGINIYFPKEKKVFIMNFKQCKLMLRPISYLDTLEGNYLRDQYRGKLARFTNGDINETPESFAFLLKHYFDTFGLIDAGLAIDKTKM